MGESAVPIGCSMEAQGAPSCGVRIPRPDGPFARPCELGYRFGADDPEPDARLIFSMFLRIPEEYLGVEQSICNHSCQFCHSHFFTQHPRGTFYTVDQLVAGVLNYAFRVTVIEPKERATFFHSGELCRHGGSCVLQSIRIPTCPGILAREQVLISPMGFGPACNIASFTGGDFQCRPRFLARVTRQLRNTLNHIEGTPEEILNLIRGDPAWDERRARIFEDFSRLKKRWVDECSLLFGGMDILALDVVHAKDGKELILELNDSTIGFPAEFAREDMRAVRDLVIARMDEGTRKLQENQKHSIK